MDEKKLREALKEYFDEYEKMQKRMFTLIDKFKEQVPINTADTPRAMEIYLEELETRDLHPEIKTHLRLSIRQILRKTPEYVT